jgi:hypothetical protein
MITDTLFAQKKLDANKTADLYVVPMGSTAMGTLWIAAHNGYDIVSVALIPRGANTVLIATNRVDSSRYIMRNTELAGNVPIYLQQLYLNHGDRIQISSVTGDSSFTFTGEKYT